MSLPRAHNESQLGLINVYHYGLLRCMETVNFEKIVNDLRDAGYSDVHLAKLCDCSKQYIGKIKRGLVRNVRHSIGSILIKLHEAL